MTFKRLVLSGGGLKGLAYIGVLKYLEERPDLFGDIKEYIGTSIGSFVCLLISLRYTSDELSKIFMVLDPEKLRKPILSTFLKEYGLDNGDNIEKLLKILISNKGHDENIKLSELNKITGTELVVCCTNVSTKKTKFFNGTDDPDAPVHLIIRMSMCIPMIFSPVLYKNEYFIDGALTNDFPVKYPTEIPEECLCVRLLSSVSENEITNIESYMRNLLKIAFDANNIVNEKYAKDQGMCVIRIYVKYSNTVNFSISNEDKAKISSEGYETFKNFF
jgi:predicted acylesterase/phospholipase RssA